MHTADHTITPLLVFLYLCVMMVGVRPTAAAVLHLLIVLFHKFHP